MKTEVRKEHGDWIVFVDDNPQFSFMYREEAEKVRNMVEVGIIILKKLQSETEPVNAQDQWNLQKALKDIGVEL